MESEWIKRARLAAAILRCDGDDVLVVVVVSVCFIIFLGVPAFFDSFDTTNQVFFGPPRFQRRSFPFRAQRHYLYAPFRHYSSFA